VSTLEGQIAVITGGGSGVGAALGLALARGRARLHLIGRRLEKLESIAAKARSYGSPTSCYSADLSTSSGQSELIKLLVGKLRDVDILIHSAGVYLANPIEQASLFDLDTQYHTNVRAPYALTQALVPLLKRRHGQVVFINSSSGVVAKPASSQYDSTKYALRAIADSLRAELNPHGVRILSVFLGRTASEMQEKIYKQDERPYRPELLLQPEDVASVILNALSLPGTAEVTDIHIRPMIKSI